MQLLKFIPIKLTLCLIAGILIGDYFQIDILVSLAATFIFLSLSAWSFFKKRRRNSISFGVLVVFTTLCIGTLSIALATPENFQTHYSHWQTNKKSQWRLKVVEVMKPTEFSYRYVAKVTLLENRRTSGKILLSFQNDTTSIGLAIDDELVVFGAAEALKPPLNPHQFDYRKYLKNLGISHQLRLNRRNSLVVDNQSRTLYGRTASFRNNLIEKLRSANFGKEQLGIIQALLLGQRNDISVDTYNNYKNAGAVHILAVSGLHIGILLLLLQFLLRPLEYLPNGKKLKLAVIIILLWGFAFLAGLSASVVRAVTMFTFLAYAMYLNRPSNTFNILALSMFFILLVVNPYLVFQVGFQMSYAAVFTIVWIYPLLQKLWFPKNRFIRKVWQLLSVSVAAQLGVLPISLFYFHQFPGLFFLSNLLIVPFLGLILGIGILVILLSLTNLLPEMLVKIYDSLIGIMNTIIEWVAQQEAFIFRNISFDSVQVFLAYAIIICVVLMLTRTTFKRSMALLTVIIGFQSYLWYTAYHAAQASKLVLLHQTRNSVLIHQRGNRLILLTNDRDKSKRLITDYRVGERILFLEHEDLKNSYFFDGKTIVFVDSLGVFPSKKPYVNYLCLTQSPKINLERIIDSLNPQTILADGSNYGSYVERWKKTCKKRKLPFHYTGEKGAYYFER